MFPSINIPNELSSMLGSETREFIVKPKYAFPRSQSLGLIFFGLFWCAFISIFWVAFFGNIFMGKEVRFTSNGVPTTASPTNLAPLIGPGIFIGIFTLVGFFILGAGIYNFNKEGSYFVGTPNRLVIFGSGQLRSLDWEQFTGDIKVKGTNLSGDIYFKLRTGNMRSRKDAPDEYVAEEINICGIPNVYDVERICRTHIKENDPTPLVKA